MLLPSDQSLDVLTLGLEVCQGCGVWHLAMLVVGGWRWGEVERWRGSEGATTERCSFELR